MDISYAEWSIVTCASCGQDNQVATWYIVDRAARPDLVELLASAQGIQACCVHCGAFLATAVAPILLCSPMQPGDLICVAPGGISLDSNDPRLNQLFALLVRQLGGWPEGLKPRVMFVSGGDLAAILNAEAQQGSDGWLVEQAAVAWLQNQDQDKRRELLQAIPELLYPAVDAIVVKIQYSQDNPFARDRVAKDRALLARCREVGGELALAEEIVYGPAFGVATPRDLVDVIQEVAKVIGPANDDPRVVLPALEQLRQGLNGREHRPVRAAVTIRAASLIQNMAMGSSAQAAGLEQAKALYEPLLADASALVRETPQVFAQLNFSLGTAYLVLFQGRSDNHAFLRRAIACFEAATAHLDAVDSPILYARTWNNLGASLNALADVESDHAAVLVRSATCYEKVLDIYTPDKTPTEYATTQKNLGIVYERLSEEGSLEHIRRAIGCYEQALRFISFEIAPREYGVIQQRLGDSYARLQDPGNPWQRAIVCYQEALHYFTVEREMQRGAQLRIALGLLLERHAGSDYPEYSQAAAHHIAEAAEMYRTAGDNEGQAEALISLGAIYAETAKRGSNELLLEAIAVFEQAAALLNATVNPESYRNVCRNLAHAYVDLSFGSSSVDKWQDAIDWYNRALAITSCTERPKDYAELHFRIGAAWADRPAVDKAEYIKQSIKHYERALEIYTLESNPKDYARTVRNLGLALSALISNGAVADWSRAHDCFTEALKVYTNEDYPNDYAQTQRYLATLYIQHESGNREASRQQAINHLEAALQGATNAENAEEKADICVLLAKIYLQPPATDVSRGESYLMRALNYYQPDRDPEYHARLLIMLGNRIARDDRLSYAESFNRVCKLADSVFLVLRSESDARLYADVARMCVVALANEQSIEQLESVSVIVDYVNRALAMIDREHAPVPYALALSARVAARCLLAEMQLFAILDDIIADLEDVCMLLHEYDLPHELTVSMTQMSILWWKRPTGDHIANLERAIKYGKEALKVAEKASMRVRAELFMQLGNCYRDLPIGDHEVQSRVALDYIRQAQQCFDPATDPTMYAMLKDLEGATYKTMLGPERAQNLHHAIACHEEALRLTDPVRKKYIYATYLHNLAFAYADLPSGDRTANLRRAIAAYTESLDAKPADRYPLARAQTLINLGFAYYSLPTGNRVENLRRAITFYEEVLALCTPENAPLLYASTQHNLGLALLAFPDDNREDLLQQAIICYREALRFHTAEAAPMMYAMSQHNLGLIYRRLHNGDRSAHTREAIACFKESLRFHTRDKAPFEFVMTQINLGRLYEEREDGDRRENLLHAINHFRHALEVATPDIAPRDCRRAAHGLAKALTELEEWPQALVACRTAIKAAESLFRSAYVPESQADESDENSAIYNLLVTICSRSATTPALLREGMLAAEAGKARLFLDQMRLADISTPRGVPEQLQVRERELMRKLREVDRALVTGIDPQVQLQLADRRSNLLEDLDRTWDEMLRACGAARDYIALRRAESSTWEDVQELTRGLGPNVALVDFVVLADEIVAYVMCAGWENPHLVHIPITRAELYHRYMLVYEREILVRPAGVHFKHEWLGLGERLLKPLIEILGNRRLVYFLPHQWLHQLPLHALTVDGQPFIATYAVAYAPSAGALLRNLQRNVTREPARVPLVVGYTRGQNPIERAIFLGEAQSLANLFGCRPYIDGAATCELLNKQAVEASIIHLSCHGRFDHNDPLYSGVLLADGVFSARDWMQLSLTADLITLSACQTGMSEISSGDDLVGLTRALLYAGASSVLLTLWSVDAAATLAWMLDFYRAIIPHAGTAAPTTFADAFRAATLKLRASNADPFYWAPFVLTGEHS